MESCSKEASFRRYYSPNFTFAKPDYFFDDNLDNEELRDIFETTRALYNKSPKKENRQPTNNGNFNKITEKSKRGTYNFNSPNNQNQSANSAFITREEMMVTKRKKPLQEEKIVWTNPK